MCEEAAARRPGPGLPGTDKHLFCSTCNKSVAQIRLSSFCPRGPARLQTIKLFFYWMRWKRSLEKNHPQLKANGALLSPGTQVEVLKGPDRLGLGGTGNEEVCVLFWDDPPGDLQAAGASSHLRSPVQIPGAVTYRLLLSQQKTFNLDSE